MRKSFAALIAATCVVSASAAAQENWPQRQVTIVMRSATAPDLPTIGETLKDYEATAWQGLFAPAGTPSPIIERIAAEVKRIWDLPAVATALRNVGGEPATSSPDEFKQYNRAERARWGGVVKAAGAQID